MPRASTACSVLRAGRSGSVHDVDDADLTRTGEPRVDAALARLAEVDEAPLTEHVGIYDDVHRMLQDALADLDEDG